MTSIELSGFGSFLFFLPAGPVALPTVPAPDHWAVEGEVHISNKAEQVVNPELLWTREIGCLKKHLKYEPFQNPK